jgi:toxin HigB-1
MDCIGGLRHKGLDRDFTKSERKGIDATHEAGMRHILDRLAAATRPEDMNLPGYRSTP